MTNKSWFWLFFIFSCALPIKSGLRNYAVVGQIILGVATMCYGWWRYRNLPRQIG